MELHDSTKQPTPVVNLIYLRRLTDRSLFLSGVEFCRVLELFLHGDGAILVEILRVVRSGRDRAAGTALRRTPSPAGMRRSSLAWPPFGRSLGLFAVVKLRQSGFKILLCNVAIVALVQLLDDLRRAGPLFVALRLHHVAEFVRGYLAVLVGVGCFEQLLGELGSHLLDGGCVVARTRTPDRTYHGFSYKTESVPTHISSIRAARNSRNVVAP